MGAGSAWSASWSFSESPTLFSHNRKAIRWHTVGWAFALQLLFAFLVLYWEAGKNALESVLQHDHRRDRLRGSREARFLFGWLAGPMDDLGSDDGHADRRLHLRASKCCRSSSSSPPSSRSSTTSGSCRRSSRGWPG